MRRESYSSPSSRMQGIILAAEPSSANQAERLVRIPRHRRQIRSPLMGTLPMVMTGCDRRLVIWFICCDA